MQPLIQNISDTARWVAIFRAEESERPDAVFHDPFARRLAGEKGEQIANAIDFSRKNSWAWVARTFLFDEFVQQQIAAGVDTIINLAAGLDARAWRMSLPPSLHWIEIDLPEISAYKRNMLADEKPKCRLTTIPLDLADRSARQAVFSQLGKQTSKAYIMTEGLMIYLTDEQAGGLALDLSAQSSFHHWAFDMVSPGLLAMAQKEMGSDLAAANAIFQFAPPEGEAFFEQYGWKPVVSKFKLKTAAQLNRLSDEMMKYAALPEPEGPRGAFPWSGVCLFENKNKH